MYMRVDANGGFCMVSLDYRRISLIWIISSSKIGITKQQRSRYIWKTISTGPDNLISRFVCMMKYPYQGAEQYGDLQQYDVYYQVCNMTLESTERGEQGMNAGVMTMNAEVLQADNYR